MNRDSRPDDDHMALDFARLRVSLNHAVLRPGPIGRCRSFSNNPLPGRGVYPSASMTASQTPSFAPKPERQLLTRVYESRIRAASLSTRRPRRTASTWRASMANIRLTAV